MTPEAMEWMAEHGESFTLTKSEDQGNYWECSWVTGGDRFTCFAGTPPQAIRCVLRKVMASMERDGYSIGNSEMFEQLTDLVSAEF